MATKKKTIATGTRKPGKKASKKNTDLSYAKLDSKNAKKQGRC